MDRTIKHKLCWNCEGRVQFDVENCPFCGVYLSPSIIKEAPPEVPPPLYQKRPDEETNDLLHAYKEESKDNETVSETAALPSESKEVILPLALLLSGSIFCIFGLVLFLFSKDGTLTLKWDANFFPFYLAGGALLFFLGWRALNKLKEDKL